MWGAIASVGAKASGHRRLQGRRSSTRRRPRKLTTSELAIKRYESRKRGQTRGQSKPLPGRGPRYTGGRGTVDFGPIGRRPKSRIHGDPGNRHWRGRGVNTGSRGRPVGRGRRPTSTTSQAAIRRSRARIARRR
jgi:hypothetical protein